MNTWSNSICKQAQASTFFPAVRSVLGLAGRAEKYTACHVALFKWSVEHKAFGQRETSQRSLEGKEVGLQWSLHYTFVTSALPSYNNEGELIHLL